MARKNKNTESNIASTTQAESTELSIKEVWDVLEFSKNLINGMYPGILTPDLLSSRMKEVSYTPKGLTEEDLTKALSDPKNSEESLRSIVEYIELISAPFRRVLAYMASQLALDLTYVVNNVEKIEDYKSPAFKKDQKVVFEFLDRFDYKYHFRNVIKQLLRNELCVVSYRDEGQQIVLQELPLQRIRLTGKWDFGYLCSFDMLYFLQPGVDISLYHPFFKKKFAELFGDGSDIQKYNPHLPPEMRGESQYIYWVDLPPQVAFVFKLDPSITTAVPYYASLVPDLLNQPTIRSLQKNSYIAAASKLLVGQVPLLKESKAQVKDMIAIDPSTLGKFLALVKSGLSETVKVVSAPLEQMQSLEYTADNEMYDKYLRTAISASGVNSALIYSGTLKANAVESQLSQQSDSLIMEDLYPQFNSFMNYYVNKLIKKYKYSFEFEGNSYYLDREHRLEAATTLAGLGMVLPQKFAAARGIKPHNFIRMLEESKGMGFVDNLLTPIVPAAQMSGAVKGNGRPSKPDSDLSDSGAETRSAGSNQEKGGSL